MIAVIVIGILFRKKSEEFRNEDTRDAYFEKHPNSYGYDRRDDVSDTFDEFERKHVHKKDDSDKSDGGNVFDEFDI